MVEHDSLQAIVGGELSSVTFVGDYVQLDFNGARITAFTPPVVRFGESIWRWADRDFKNQLCNAILKRVTAAVVMLGNCITITFEGGLRVEISLRDDDYCCPEAVMFNHGNTWWVL
jgi:hypothetical protein